MAHVPGSPALLSTPLGTLSLPAELPVGADVTLEVLAPPIPPPPAPAAASTAPGLGQGGWPALNEALTVLTAQDPQAAQQLMRAMPQMGPQLAANLSLFANALRSGDTKAIIGEGAVRGLEKGGRRDLADKLKDDVDELSAESERPVDGGNWRGFTLPILTGAEILPVHLFVRQQPEPEEDDVKSGGGGRRGTEHRFLLEVSMTRLGRFQLDGLIQRDTKRFDLIIRTALALPDHMRHDILGLFANAGDLAGTKGSVTFQGGGRFIDLPPAPAPTTCLNA